MNAKTHVIRRTKNGATHWATSVAPAGNITGWSPDRTAALPVDDATVAKVKAFHVKRAEKPDSRNVGQIAFEPNEAPPTQPPPKAQALRPPAASKPLFDASGHPIDPNGNRVTLGVLERVEEACGYRTEARISLDAWSKSQMMVRILDTCQRLFGKRYAFAALADRISVEEGIAAEDARSLALAEALALLPRCAGIAETRDGADPADPWADYRSGPGGPLLTAGECWDHFAVSNPVLSRNPKAKATRRKNPDGRGFVYRYDVVSLLSNRKELATQADE